MNLNEFEQLFKSIVEGYPTGGLFYTYNRMWAFNGMPSATFPAVLLERQMQVKFEGNKSNLLPMFEVFEFKVFFFDTYHHAERGAKEWSQKQTELLEIARQVFAEIERRDRDGLNIGFKYSANFFGDIDRNNGELLELACNCSVRLQNNCVKLNWA